MPYEDNHPLEAPTKDDPRAPADAFQCSRRPAAQRLAPFPKFVDLGEDVLGSAHLRDLFTPRPEQGTCDNQPFTMEATVTSASVMSRNSNAFMPAGQIKQEFDGRQPFQIYFWPRHEGLHEGQLRFDLGWADGASLTREMRVTIGRSPQQRRHLSRTPTTPRSMARSSQKHNNDRGHLRIRITTDSPQADQASIKVQSAAIYGISQEMADTFLDDATLATGALPILVIVNGKGLISRDEAGRIRTHHLPISDARGAVDDEAQQYRHAKILLDKLFGQTLRNQGVHKIVTDDKAD